MKITVCFTDFNPSLEVQGDNSVYHIWNKAKDFIFEAQRNILSVLEKSINILEELYPIIDRVDKYYQEHEGAGLIVKIELYPKLFCEGNFCAEIQIYAPGESEFSFSKTNKFSDDLQLWQPKELQDELTALSKYFVFSQKNNGKDGIKIQYLKKIITGGEK